MKGLGNIHSSVKAVRRMRKKSLYKIIVPSNTLVYMTNPSMFFYF